jgi:hypothetical protein
MISLPAARWSAPPSCEWLYAGIYRLSLKKGTRKSRRNAKEYYEGPITRSGDYDALTMPWVSAYLIKSALVCRLRWSMICPL